MASTGLQILGIVLTLLGWVNALVSCVLPLWKVTAFIGNSIVVAQMVWKGLWMSCVVQSTGQMQCKVYDSPLALPQDLQAARALCVVTLLIVLFGLLVYLAGAKCTTCVEDKNSKSCLVLVSGIIFVISGVLTLIPVCWTAHAIIQDFYNPLVADAPKVGAGGLPLSGLGSLGPFAARWRVAVLRLLFWRAPGTWPLHGPLFYICPTFSRTLRIPHQELRLMLTGE